MSIGKRNAESLDEFTRNLEKTKILSKLRVKEGGEGEIEISKRLASILIGGAVSLVRKVKICRATALGT